LIIEVIDKRPFHPVIKQDPDKAKSPGKLRMPLFNNLTLPPKGMAKMHNPVAYPQV